MNSQYQFSGFDRRYFATTKAVKLLIYINIIVFLLVEVSGLQNEIYRVFGLVPTDFLGAFKLWQPVTYLFLHGGFLHIFMNMFVFWMFGRDLEKRWGEKRFLQYFFITGAGSGLVTVLFSLNSVIPVVGASGAVYGILLAYGVLFPNRIVLVMAVFPVKVKYFIGFLAAATFFATLSPDVSPVSHMTHLSGMLIGYGYLLFMARIKVKPKVRKIPIREPRVKKDSPVKPEQKVDKSLLQRRVDDVLDKMKDVGWDGLTHSEQNILFDASKRSAQKQPPN